MEPQEVGCGSITWVDLSQVRERWQVLVNAVMNIPVPQNVGNFVTA